VFWVYISANSGERKRAPMMTMEPAGDETAPAGVTVVVNWLNALRRRVRN
jgi:hypothetical protein